MTNGLTTFEKWYSEEDNNGDDADDDDDDEMTTMPMIRTTLMLRLYK